MTDEFMQNGNHSTPGVVDSSSPVMAESGLSPDGVQMVSPSPLGAIAKSKALVEARPKTKASLMSMIDVPVTLVMEVGRTEISVEELMELVEGSIIDLRKVSVDSIEVRMNEKIIAQAEAIALQQRYGIRFTTLEKMIAQDKDEKNAG